MLVEVFTNEKAPLPRRAMTASLALLLAAGTLAWGIAWQRSGNQLAPRVSPEGWAISFQPPRRLSSLRSLSTSLGPAYLFNGLTRSGTPTVLVVYRLTDPIPKEALSVCVRVLSASMFLAPPGDPGARPEPIRSRLGSRDAVEVQDQRLGMIVRAVVLDKTEAYAIAVGVEGTGMDPDAYRLFNLTCESVEFRSP